MVNNYNTLFESVLREDSLDDILPGPDNKAYDKLLEILKQSGIDVKNHHTASGGRFATIENDDEHRVEFYVNERVLPLKGFEHYNHNHGEEIELKSSKYGGGWNLSIDYVFIDGKSLNGQTIDDFMEEDGSNKDHINESLDGMLSACEFQLSAMIKSLRKHYSDEIICMAFDNITNGNQS